jgi:hypothetical protein
VGVPHAVAAAQQLHVRALQAAVGEQRRGTDGVVEGGGRGVARLAMALALCDASTQATFSCTLSPPPNPGLPADVDHRPQLLAHLRCRRYQPAVHQPPALPGLQPAWRCVPRVSRAPLAALRCTLRRVRRTVSPSAAFTRQHLCRQRACPCHLKQQTNPRQGVCQLRGHQCIGQGRPRRLQPAALECGRGWQHALRLLGHDPAPCHALQAVGFGFVGVALGKPLAGLQLRAGAL